MNKPTQTSWARANAAFRNKEFDNAVALYEEAIGQADERLKTRIRFNLDIALQRLGGPTTVLCPPTNLARHDTNSSFDIGYYLSNNEDVKNSHIDPQAHYWTAGEREGRWPNPYFDPKFYLKTNADVRIAKISPFRHYIDSGCREGRLGCTPHPQSPRPVSRTSKPLLFVGHDGIQAGSEVVLLEIIRWFFESTLRRVKLLLLEPGPLVDRYAHFADVYVLPKNNVDEPNTLKEFLSENFQFAYLNTVVSGRFLQIIADQNIRLNVPIVAHLHEMEKVIDIFSGEMQSLKNGANHWITASPATTDIIFKKHNISLSNITTVPAFINPIARREATTNELKTKARLALGLSEGVFVVMGCGTAYWRKGIDIFVDAARHMRLLTKQSICFVWVGDGPDRSLHEASLSAEERIFIAFAGNRTDANFLLAAADVFFLASREDPFPLVVLESAQHGVPSVCFAHATGITEFIGDDAGIALEQMSAESAANVLVELLHDDYRRQQLGETARQKLFEQYTADKQNMLIHQAVSRYTGYQPSVSVIVPFYNHDAFVVERLDSILRQSIKDIEIIVLDDCSTDKTVERITPYLGDGRIRLIKNSYNSGSPFKQWEKGIAEARGSIVWIAEGDDSCASNFLSSLLPYFDDTMVNIAAAKTEIIDEHGQIKAGALDPYLDMACPGKFQKSYINDGFLEVNQQFGAMCTLVNASGLLIRKSSIVHALKSAQEFKMCGDWFLYLGCLAGGKIAYDVSTCNFFRRHANSQVHKIEGTPTYFAERQKITEYVLEHYPVTHDLIKRIFDSIDHEWMRFKHKCPGNELNDLYDKNYLQNKANYIKHQGHVAFYVHGMTFSKGGIERLASQLANFLVENGWQVTIYSRVSSSKKSIYPLYNAIQIHPIFDESKLEISISFLSQALVKDKVDVLVPMLSEWLFEPIIEAAQNAGVTILASEHNDPWKIEELWWSQERRHECFAKADAIHLLLNKFTESLPIGLQKKVITIPNGVEIPPNLSLDNREKLIIGVGRLEPQKRFDRLIDAVVKIQTPLRESAYRVEIYGEGSLYMDLNLMIENHGVADLISLKGNTDCIDKVYDRGSFFVLPSEFEGFGIVVIEALAHGLPVIAYKNCNGPNEIIRPLEEGLLVNSIDQMANAILFFMKNTDYRVRELAFKRAEQYSLPHFFTQWSSALKRLIGNGE